MLQEIRTATEASLLSSSVALAAVLFVTIMEAWKVRVRTKVTLPLLLLGLVYHALKEGGPGFAQSLLAALVGLGLLMALHLLHGITAGDVGLMTAVSAWLGMPLAVYVLGISALTAGSYAAVRALVRREVGTLRIKMQLAWHRAPGDRPVHGGRGTGGSRRPDPPPRGSVRHDGGLRHHHVFRRIFRAGFPLTAASRLSRVRLGWPCHYVYLYSTNSRVIFPSLAWHKK